MADSIFISVVAYRDPELSPTLESALSTARRPDRLVFGVVWHRGPEEPAALPVPARQCRLVTSDASAAKGVCSARAEAQALWRGETYFLQIDSHLRFVEGWDELSVEELRACPGKALLTAYGPGYRPPDRRNKAIPSRLVPHVFTDAGVLLPKVRPIRAPGPVLGMFIAGMYLFAPGRFAEEVPYDPDLYFFGEEMSLSVRAWTRGWDIYHPSRVFFFHHYDHGGARRRRHWDDHAGWEALDKRAQARASRCIQRRGTYGLGNERTLAEYQRFSGVDFRTGEVTRAALRGELNLDWARRGRPLPDAAINLAPRTSPR